MCLVLRSTLLSYLQIFLMELILRGSVLTWTKGGEFGQGQSNPTERACRQSACKIGLHILEGSGERQLLGISNINLFARLLGVEPGPGGFVLVAAPGVHAHAVIGVLCCGPQEILVEDGDAGDLSGVSLDKYGLYLSGPDYAYDE